MVDFMSIFVDFDQNRIGIKEAAIFMNPNAILIEIDLESIEIIIIIYLIFIPSPPEIHVFFTFSPPGLGWIFIGRVVMYWKRVDRPNIMPL